MCLRKTLKGSLGGNARPQIDIPKFINLDKRKIIKINKIIHKTINFKDINKGISMFQSKKNTGRILIKF